MSDAEKWLDDVFGIPLDGSNIDDVDDDIQDNAYTEIGKGVNHIPFEEKAKGILSSVASPDVELFEFVESEKKEDGNEKLQKETVVFSPEIHEENAQISSDTEVVSESTIGDIPSRLSSVLCDENDVRYESQCIIRPPSAIDLTQWNVDAPNPKFKTFYEHKISLVEEIQRQGMLPFDQYQEELKTAFVPISNAGRDPNIIFDQMEKIQRWRDRVSQIFLDVEPQLFWWKRAVDQMRGMLAMTQYEKPKERQEGMNYLHLRDMEFYLSRLEGLKSNCTIIMKNLEAAYETLSRQLAIIMPVHDVRQIQSSNTSSAPKNNVSLQQPVDNVKKEECPFDVDDQVKKSGIEDILSGFDVLNSDNDSVKPSIKKDVLPIQKGVKKVAWADIGKKK